ncbi:DUF5686 and carboxypeptidase-like regulatory domain-containing protein [Spirosoma spitsbergense]|uniref:DUF5686 and carboxypeptidase-like regulatory domain-containing protein n=1 Tax=Spirosoma spitsbergense TaxID=431554 RepID=UPI00035C725E|nr:DUF5686 and carboxypeptidase-like regulatory domain-containing protein [Spirosoma spitsbergense]
MNKLLLLGLIFWLMLNPVFGQVKVHGQVVSERSGQGIPFATVGVEQTTNGTMADSSGRFSLTVPAKNDTLLVRSLGYETRRIATTEASRITLKESHLTLNEVRIKAVNPAHRIIEQATQNLPRNNPEALASFQYEGYHVSTISHTKAAKPVHDTPVTKPLYVNESYSIRQFLAPTLNHEEIIGSRTSGTQATLFASFRPMFQPFGFHKETILIRLPRMTEPISFLNPLSRNSAAVYDFYLADTLVHTPGDSTFVIEYEPKKGRGISGLKGVLHIRSGSFAPTYVTAEPADPKTVLRFRFEQTYKQIKKHWFPVEIRSNWIISPSSVLKMGAVEVETRSLLTNIQIDLPLRAENFSEIALLLADNSTRRSEEFWQTHRLDSLTIAEKDLFARQAALRGWARFKTKMLPTLAEWGTAGVVPLGKYLNMSSQTFFDGNRYEGLRLTLNPITSPAFSKTLRLDAKLSYGFRDQAVKYEGRARLLLNPARRMYLTAAYRFDVSEPGNVQFFIWDYPQIPYELLRTFLFTRADSLQQWRVEWSFRAVKHTTVTFSVADETRTPTYTYLFRPPEYEHMPMTSFSTTELSAGFRYAYNEQFAQVGQGTILAQAPSPVWSVQVVQGVMNRLLGGHYNYTKLNTRYEQLIRHRRLGETYLNLTAGILWGQLPYPYLYNARGAKNDFSPIWVANHFQTMDLYEFTSDRYATLFVTHNFKTLLGKPTVRWFRPEPSVVQGIAYGSLRSPDYHEGIPIKTLERGFFESGLLVDNLYRQRIANVAYVGVGMGVFYRWGPNALPIPQDNLAYRLVWNIGF